MQIFETISFVRVARLALLMVLGLPTIWFIAHCSRRLLAQRVSAHMAMLVGNIVLYIGLALVAISLIQELGFNISAILGAAGVVGIAIGFAAKTTVANIISGIFLLIERPFVVGDRISCAGTSGIVESVDLMSVKLQTVSGQLVRIPNEMLICQTMTNISFYPKRRIVFNIQFQPGQDIAAIMLFLQNMVEQESMILADPKPLVALKGYGQYAVEVVVRFWIKQKDVKLIYQQLAVQVDQYGKQNNVWIGLAQE